MEKRIIKYKAWDIQKKQMNHNPVFYIDDGAVNSGFEDTDFIFSQFTGSTDVHGNDIYEGDIVNSSGVYSGKAKVEWNDRGYYELVYESGNVNFIPQKEYHELYGFEVIGNIYENPELLTN